MTAVDVTITYLQMLDPGQLRPRACERSGWRVERAPRDPAINRDYYRDVGAAWHWVDRLSWSDAWWHTHAHQPELTTYVGYLDNEPIGYFELHHRTDSGVEIAYFGLLPRFIGQSFGGALLTEAVTFAWQLGPSRVWLHTCTLDHPQALANYQARGFEIYNTETKRQAML
ncbi:MAG: GNAT family N-acetyltransferase [Pirellulales bacterium]